MSMIAEYLQSKFECKKCGKCCSQGGDMSLRAEDVIGIAKRLELAVWESVMYFVPDLSGRDGYAMVRDQCPCQFLDRLDKTCTVHDCKPLACKDYPFLLYERGGCAFDAVLVCPEARRLLEDLLQGEL